MIELIGIVCCIAAIIGLPIQTAKIRTGWMPKRFKGTFADYLAAYRKQLNMLVWVGVVLGAINIVLAVIPQGTPNEWIAKAVSAGLWFVLGALSYFSKRSLEGVTAPAQA
jgi:hypothetical protein